MPLKTATLRSGPDTTTLYRYNEHGVLVYRTVQFHADGEWRASSYKTIEDVVDYIENTASSKFLAKGPIIIASDPPPAK